ncbi:hypothetical protein BDZ97DRAFT_1829161 [Flammula alnicola]|nr:hypothetical protein BDZ97DRAFT_1829161 [Flammula alnicola]
MNFCAFFYLLLNGQSKEGSLDVFTGPSLSETTLVFRSTTSREMQPGSADEPRIQEAVFYFPKTSSLICKDVPVLSPSTAVSQEFQLDPPMSPLEGMYYFLNECHRLLCTRCVLSSPSQGGRLDRTPLRWKNSEMELYATQLNRQLRRYRCSAPQMTPASLVVAACGKSAALM